jgi:hypothetical protein
LPLQGNQPPLVEIFDLRRILFHFSWFNPHGFDLAYQKKTGPCSAGLGSGTRVFHHHLLPKKERESALSPGGG